MAVTSIVPHPVGYDGSSGGPGRDQTSAAWKVFVDSPNDTATSIGAAITSAPHPPYGIQVPNFLAQHPDDPNQTARNLAVRQKKHWKCWIATLSFSSEDLSQRERERIENPDPLNMAPDISYAPIKVNGVIMKDRFGLPLDNSAADEFDPSDRQGQFWHRGIVIVSNIVSPPTWFLDLEGTPPVNDAAVVIDGLNYPAGKLLLGDYSIGPIQERNQVLYREVQMSLEYNKDGHELQIVDAGFHEFSEPMSGSPDCEGIEKQLILLKNGRRPTTPQKLDGAGQQLAPCEDAVVLKFDVNPVMDFTQFPGVEPV